MTRVWSRPSEPTLVRESTPLSNPISGIAHRPRCPVSGVRNRASPLPAWGRTNSRKFALPPYPGVVSPFPMDYAKEIVYLGEIHDQCAVADRAFARVTCAM